MVMCSMREPLIVPRFFFDAGRARGSHFHFHFSFFLFFFSFFLVLLFIKCWIKRGEFAEQKMKMAKK